MQNKQSLQRAILLLLFPLLLVAKTQTIVLGAGCFWGVEKFFSQLKGVKDVEVGYAGGNYKNPTYEKVLAHRNQTITTNHAEVVKVIYDDTQLSTKELLQAFWEIHDPTQGDKQGNDLGNNYRSIILSTTPQQHQLALQTKTTYQKLLFQHGYNKITTQITPLHKFYKAEIYHQDYLKKHPNGYCPNHATGVKFVQPSKKSSLITPLGNKEIVVITSPNCPFCDSFQKEVLDSYHATIPLRKIEASQLKDFTLQTKIFATPTIFFIKDGVEQFAHVGAMDTKSFYKEVAHLKLGTNSKAYDVAFHQATDGRFCKKYQAFKHTGDGVFVDKISGEILFDTRDRFNSGSGWLSFYKAVDGATIKKDDNSYGMHRVEIIAKKSGAHLGHRFHDAPNKRYRYCINATVLEFVPRNKITEYYKLRK